MASGRANSVWRGAKALIQLKKRNTENGLERNGVVDTTSRPLDYLTGCTPIAKRSAHLVLKE